MRGKELLQQGLRFQVGNGENIHSWDDPWLPLPYTFKPFSLPMHGSEGMRVCELIEEGTGGWNEWLLEELFTPMESEIILKIPLSLNGGEDRLVWHFDNKGCYNVKSGYFVGRLLDGLNRKASGSDSNVQWSRLWCKLWRTQVPPKVRMHAWRLVKGTLPSRAALVKKQVQLPDVNCVFYSTNVEDSLHLFKNCEALQPFWQQGMVQIHPRTHPSISVEVWFWYMVEMLSGEKLEGFLMALWVIWVERNNMVWRGQFYNITNMMDWSSSLLLEYKHCHQRSVGTRKKNKSKWTCPPSGRLRVNIDGSFAHEEGRGGVGVVIRDHKGACVASLARPFPNAVSAIHMEVEALRAGLLVCVQQGWRDVEVESDCMNLVQVMQTDGEDFSMVGRIIEDCQRYVSAFNFFQLQHVCREANSVANRLVHFARCNNYDDFSLDETPAIIQDVLYEDLCNSSLVHRGSGYMSPSMKNFISINETGRGAEPPS
ncbi:hypothetical protein ACLB2K_001492 [Fragaria x ananassa]